MAYATSNGTDIYYEVHGTGSPIVLSAGMGGSGAFWTPQLAALAQRHQVVIYDHVGTGRSGRDSPCVRDIEGMADDIACVMDHAGVDAAHIVGHAIGGIVGIVMATRHPRRMRSLTVVNGWAQADPFVRRCFEVRKQILNQSGQMAYIRAQPLFLYPPQWIADNIALLENDEAHMLANFPSVATMNGRIDLFLAFDGRAGLADIQLPTLLASAKDDALVPSYLSHQLAAAIPRAKLREVGWGAHAFTAVTPGVFNAMLLTFCEELDA